jgi:putative DNA primase/helicase
MNAAAIARALRGAPNGRGFLCRCPLTSHGKGRGDRSPSLSIWDGDDSRLGVKCFAGCDGRDVKDELRRRGLLDDAEPVHVIRKARRAPPPLIEPDPDALSLWRQREPIGEETPVRRYLRARGIADAPPPSLGFLPAYEHIAGRVYLPAICAALQAGDRRVIAVQITMIDPRGDRKAQVRFPRKTIGRMHDGAVRLAAAGEELGIAEGIETGLSAMKLFDVPVWCALGAGRMHNVCVPADVRTLHLFADSDEAGETAVARMIEVHRRRRVIVHRPLSPGADFNDALVELNQEVAW